MRLSRASGATPISAAICLRFRHPSSGTSASYVRLTTGAIVLEYAAPAV
jgi:hypothetical protein